MFRASNYATILASKQTMAVRMQHDEFDDSLPEKPSKTQRKREVEALQALGETLLNFKPAKLESLNLPDELMAALIEAHRIPRKKAERRQNQYIGRLMRGLDQETLEAIHQFLALRQRGR